MKAKEIKMIIRRFLELLISNAIISAIIATLNKLGILSTRPMLFWALLVGVILFVFINVFFLRNCYFELKERKRYYIVNIVAYVFYALLMFIINGIGWNQVYAWLFATTKVLRFTSVYLDTMYSALFFHGICLAMIFLAPFGVDWDFLFEDEERELEMNERGL